jgi:predicted MPP superfamily phosphohydrolase
MNRFVLFSIVLFLLDCYFYRAIKTISDQVWISRLYWTIDILILASIIAFIVLENYHVELPPVWRNVILAGVFLSLIPKLVGVVILFSEDIVRVFTAIVKWLVHFFSASSENSSYLPDRRKFVSQLALGLAAIPFTGMAYGILTGKYNYKIRRIRLLFKNLPDAFHGFTLTQLSDIHSGSFDSPKDVARGVKMANDLQSDLILFTGDLVNSQAKEMAQWIDVFSQLKAQYGKISVLGNHDYGDYHHWENEKAKEENLEQLKKVHAAIGFNLLLNQHIRIEKDGESIVVAGVENWGKMGFQQYGDLDKALENVNKDQFTLLLSHDPSHWDEKVLKHPHHVNLTLSGHTHGMQMGVEIPGFRWSPSQYVYKRWAGIYEEKGHYLYVNRGFGFLGFPGRVGILPEITVITLERA